MTSPDRNDLRHLHRTELIGGARDGMQLATAEGVQRLYFADKSAIPILLDGTAMGSPGLNVAVYTYTGLRTASSHAPVRLFKLEDETR